MFPMFTTVDPAGLRADLQLVSGVQSEGKLYEWLSIVSVQRGDSWLQMDQQRCELAVQMLGP